MPRLNFTKHDVRALREIARRVEQVPSKIRGVCESMELEELETITVTNYRSLMLGLQKLETFASELERTFLNWKHEQGAYLADGESVPDLHERMARKEKKPAKKKSPRSKARR